MTWLWTFFWVACSSTDVPFDGPIRARPPTFVDPGLAASGASPVAQLWRIDGTFVLPQTTLPEDFALAPRFRVEMERVRVSKRAEHWGGTSPFTDTVRARVGAPAGMSLWVGDREVPFSQGPEVPSWRVRGDRVLVSWPEEDLPPVTMAWDRALQGLLRRDFGTVGGDPATFSRIDVTVADHTRPGLLLPAPASASFDLTLPQGARFEGWPVLAPVALRSQQSDGAWVALQVIAADGDTQVDRRFLRAGAPFEAWRVDLRRWAGQRVTVKLSSEVYSRRDFDHVFVGSPTVWGDASGDTRRVVVIGLDTTRPDHFGFYGYGRPTTPEIDAFLQTSTVFDHAWTPAPRTRPSFRSATTGRNPLDAVGATNIGAVFQAHGFVTAGIVANVHLQPRFDFHHGFDRWWFDGRAGAKDQVDRALSFLAEYPERDAYLFVHFMDPHLLYRPPEKLERDFVRDPDPTLPGAFTRWDVVRWARSGELTERRQQNIMDLYDAELRGMSIELGRLFDQLDRMPGKSLIVLHNDHGEEFWEHGGFEHNHTLYDEVTRAVLAFRTPPGQAEGRRVSVPATLADIAPTLFDFADFQDVPPTDGVSLAPLLLGAAPDEPMSERALGVAHLRYGTERWGVVYRGHKYVLHTYSGQEELYDLAADPREQHDLSGSVDLAPWRKALSTAHHMPVGPGWRIEVTVVSPDRRPLKLALPAKAVGHGVIDPEAATVSPANQAWGEVPSKRPSEVGETRLDDNGRTLVFTPAPTGIASGTLWVMFDADADPRAVTIARGDEAPVGPAPRGAVWRDSHDQIEEIRAGTVLDPPPSEAARIRTLQGQTEDAGADREALQLLGYIEEDDPTHDDE